MTDEAWGIFELMRSGMRLVLTAQGASLIADPRISYTAAAAPAPIAVRSSEPVFELTKAGLISPLPENTGDDPENCKIGWREMFAGHLDLIPEGAQVYALSQ